MENNKKKKKKKENERVMTSSNPSIFQWPPCTYNLFVDSWISLAKRKKGRFNDEKDFDLDVSIVCRAIEKYVKRYTYSSLPAFPGGFTDEQRTR